VYPSVKSDKHNKNKQIQMLVNNNNTYQLWYYIFKQNGLNLIKYITTIE